MTRDADLAAPISVSAVVLRDPDGRVLTVRKRGTSAFMLPGGKPEPGETARAAAAREVAEEVGLVLADHALRELGAFLAPAANEAGRMVAAQVFQAELTGVPRAGAEIEQLRWQAGLPTRPPADLAPLLALHVLPALAVQDETLRTARSVVE